MGQNRVNRMTVKDPALLERAINNLLDKVDDLERQLKAARRGPDPRQPSQGEVVVTPEAMQDIRAHLQLHGSYPLNVEGLLGVLASPQIAGAIIATSQPDANQYEPGTLLIVTGSPASMYYCSEGNPHTWVSASFTPTNMMTTDTDQNFTGRKTFTGTNGPALKWLPGAAIPANTLLMEAYDGTAVQKFWLDVEGDMMVQRLGVGVAPSILADIKQDSNSAAVCRMQNPNVGNAAAIFHLVKADIAQLNLIALSAAYASTLFGMAGAGLLGVTTSTGNGLAIGPTNNVPLYFGTNNVVRITVSNSGAVTIVGATTINNLLTLDRVGQALLVKPSAAGTPANTKMLELQDNAAASKWSVDIEGDELVNALTAAGLITANLGLNVNNGAFTLAHALAVTAGTAATVTPYTMLDGFVVIFSRYSTIGAQQINLIAAPRSGHVVFIKDENGNAAANNITVSGNGKNIDGAATQLINTNYGGLLLYYNGTQWLRLANF